MLRLRMSSARAVLAMVMFLWFADLASAGQVSLRWDAAPSATGYRVYLGQEAGVYTQTVDVGLRTSATVDVPWECSLAYSAVRAYNAVGESAEYSNEVRAWPQPEIESLSTVRLAQGDRRTIEIVGANFGMDTQLTFVEEADAELPTDLLGNPLLRLEDFDVVSCNRLEATAIVAAESRGNRAMAVGPLRQSVRLDSARGVFGNDFLEFAIEFSPVRADVNRDDPLSVGRVDGSDLSWLNYGHGSAEGDANYLPDADLSGDGVIDGEDLALLSTYFGRCWSGEAWVLDESQCT